MSVEAVHAMELGQEFGSVPLEVPRFGAVLSPDEVDAVNKALIHASVGFAVLADDHGPGPRAAHYWTLAARSELALAVLRTGERRTL